MNEKRELAIEDDDEEMVAGYGSIVRRPNRKAKDDKNVRHQKAKSAHKKNKLAKKARRNNW